jgi:hypothetical protein
MKGNVDVSCNRGTNQSITEIKRMTGESSKYLKSKLKDEVFDVEILQEVESIPQWSQEFLGNFVFDEKKGMVLLTKFLEN